MVLGRRGSKPGFFGGCVVTTGGVWAYLYYPGVRMGNCMRRKMQTLTPTTNLRDLTKDDKVVFRTEAPGLGIALDRTTATVTDTDELTAECAILGPYRRTTVRITTDDRNTLLLQQYETRDDGLYDIEVSGAGSMNPTNHGTIATPNVEAQP